MKQRKAAITGTVDKDQLNYESNLNPVSYNGPRIADNHDIITANAIEQVDDIQ